MGTKKNVFSVLAALAYLAPNGAEGETAEIGKVLPGTAITRQT